MSDVQQGPGWWQASDGKWYAPEQHPNYQPPPPPPAAPATPQTGPPPGYWQAPDGQWYPPQPGAHSVPKKKLYTRVWFWLLVVFALGVGGCITIVSVASVAVNKAATTKHTVVYTVTGNGTADITFDTFTNGNSGSSQDTGASLPWTKTATGSGLFNLYDVTATLSTGSTVTCTITVDGKQVASHTSTGQFATVDCTGSAA